MQDVSPPLGPANPSGYTRDEILRALRGRDGSRNFSFRYVLLDSTGKWIRDLDNVISCSVEQNWLADIKRKAKFTLADTGVINYLSDRIQPWIRMHMEPKVGISPEDNYVEWPQGVFLLSTPSRGADEEDTVTREVQGYDLLQMYLDDKTEDRYTVAAGSTYVVAVQTLLASYPVPANVAYDSATLPTTKEWEPGTAKLHIINDLLGAINYESLSFSEVGQALVREYRSPQDRPVEYVYADDQDGVIVPNVDQELDLFGVPNKWVLVVSDPDREPLSSSYTNTDPGSPTSTVRRQRTITDFRTEQDAADQLALDAKVARLAFEASQIYEVVEFETAMMPIHSGNDVYRIQYGPLAINSKYSEHSWEMDLRAGAKMKHRARRVVTV